MKKIMGIIVGVLLLLILLIYISVWSVEPDAEISSVITHGMKDTLDFRTMDSVWVAADTRYEANMLKKMMQGEHYREAWATPVYVPVIWLDRWKGGLTVMEEGGGHQTHSLELEGPDGIRYSLRSIAKDPSPIIPEIAYKLGIENIVTDGISAQHPYGALIAAKLSEAAGLLHTHPELVFVPKQEALGEFSDNYGNQLYNLEYESEGEKNWTSYTGANEIIDTEDLIQMRLEGKKVMISEHMLVRNRLFDLLIGDWDRHSGQWGWVIIKEDDGHLAIPLAADRDNAFFNMEGLIPSVISHPKVKEELRSFDAEIHYMPGLIQPFDRYFLLKTPESVFEEEARYLQQRLTDDAIVNALQAWPLKIMELNGEEVAKKLKSRRAQLLHYAREFKKEIDRAGPLKGPKEFAGRIELNGDPSGCFSCLKKLL